MQEMANSMMGACKVADKFWQTRMQVVNPTPAAIYSGIGNAITTISRAEGYMSLWRGLSSVIVGAGGLTNAQRLSVREKPS